MTDTQFSFARAGDGTETIVLMGTQGVKIVPDTHVNYEQIKAALLGHFTGAPLTEADLYELEGAAYRVAETLRRLSERVTIKGDTVFFDGDPMASRLTDHIVAMIKSGDDNWTGYVKFLENIQANPSDTSREHLFAFLEKHDLVITPEGHFVAYKSVQHDGLSHHAGREEVTVTLEDGTIEVHKGKIPNPVGATIEMPRSLVDTDRGVACSVGLHVGSFSFARGFYGGAKLLIVSINPRDVVSVPSDANDQKVRVHRYTVVEENVSREKLEGTSFVKDVEPDDDDLDEGYDEEYDLDDECGDPYCPACGPIL